MSDTVCVRDLKGGGCFWSLLLKRKKLHAACNFCGISSTRLQCVCLSNLASSSGVSLEMKGHTKLIKSHIKAFIILQKLSVPNKCCSFGLSINKEFFKKVLKFPQRYDAAQLYSTLIINVSWASNQHIWLISEGSCFTEDWSNDAENSALHHSNKLHLKNIQTYSYFKL